MLTNKPLGQCWGGCRLLRLTVGLQRRAATAESHHDGGKGQAALHAVFPDALQDVGGEVDVQVAQKHDAVAVLGEQTGM